MVYVTEEIILKESDFLPALHRKLGDQESISHGLHQKLVVVRKRQNAEWTGPKQERKENLDGQSTITRNFSLFRALPDILTEGGRKES